MRERGRLLLQLAPVGVILLAEAAWIAALEGLIAEYTLRPPELGLPGLVVFAAVGRLVAGSLGRRLDGRWPLAATAGVAGASLLGVLVDPAARAAVLRLDPAGFVASNPAGLVGGLAVLRGYAHGGDHLSVSTVTRTFAIGVPGLGLLAAAGGMVAEPHRSRFLAAAELDAAVFVGGCLLAMAFAGYAEVERSGDPTWRRNPAWLGLLGLVVAGLLAGALPLAAAAGPTIALAVQVAVSVAIVPLAVVGLAASGGAGLRRTIGFVAVGSIIVWLLALGSQGLDARLPTVGDGSGSATPTAPDAGVIGTTGIIVVLVLGAAALLARAWLRRRSEGDFGSRDDERVALPTGPERLGRRRDRVLGRLAPGRGAPRTGSEAYLALLAALRGHVDVERRAGETPAEHVGRLRATIGPGPEVDRLARLAADHALETFADRPLTAPETRRAIGRWRDLRRSLPRLGRTRAAMAADLAATLSVLEERRDAAS